MRDLAESATTTPGWLSAPQDYEARRGGGGFAEKTVRRVLGALRRLEPGESPRRTSRLRPPSPALGLAALVGFVALVSLARDAGFLTAAAAAALAALAILPGKLIRRALGVSLLAAAVTLLIVLPAYFMTPGYPPLLLPLRVFVPVTAAGAFARAYRWDEVTAALGRLRAPDILVLILDHTVRYIWLLGRFSADTLRALKCRAVGRGGGKAMPGVAGTMYLTSRNLSEETARAMEVRGSGGGYRRVSARRRRIAAGDVLLGIAIIVVVALFVYYR